MTSDVRWGHGERGMASDVRAGRGECGEIGTQRAGAYLRTVLNVGPPADIQGTISNQSIIFNIQARKPRAFNTNFNVPTCTIPPESERRPAPPSWT